MKNNYYKIVMPLISKNYFTEKNNYKYKGKAYLIFEKGTNNKVLDTLILDEDQQIHGAADGVYGSKYNLKNNNFLFEYRCANFETREKRGGKKEVVPFLGNIKELNNHILKYKLTIKNVASFITGSHSSGGLKNPDADPVRIHFENKDPIQEMFKKNIKINFLKNINISWKFFSLISNVAGKFTNHSFPDDLSIEYLESLEERKVEELFGLENLMFIPYSKSSYEYAKIPFKEAFVAQNYEIFIDPTKEKNSVSALSDYEWKNNNSIEYILNCIDKNDRRYLSRELRSTWRRIVDDDMKENNFKSDFVKGIPAFQRAHIIENANSVGILLNENTSIRDKKEYLSKLFNPNNYILLPNDIHSMWDSKLISISNNGNIINKNLSNDEFDRLNLENWNIYSIYENTINDDRSKLLNQREKTSFAK